MRTTITLDADAAALVRRHMDVHGVSFKAAVNAAIRAGLGPPPTAEPFATTAANMGVPTVNLDRSLQLAADLEDDELVRRMRTGT